MRAKESESERSDSLEYSESSWSRSSSRDAGSPPPAVRPCSGASAGCAGAMLLPGNSLSDGHCKLAGAAGRPLPARAGGV